MNAFPMTFPAFAKYINVMNPIKGILPQWPASMITELYSDGVTDVFLQGKTIIFKAWFDYERGVLVLRTHGCYDHRELPFVGGEVDNV